MKQLTSFLFFLLVAFATQLHAQATLSIQGVIKNSDGSAVDNGTYSLTFKLYETATGGSAIFTEMQDIQVTGGIYSALLGAVTPLTAAFNTTYYLGVTVEGGDELIPRARLTSSPYALSLIGQSNTFPSSGTVGVGTNAPTAGNELHVKNASGEANLLLESTSNVPRLTLKNGSTTSRLEINGGAMNLAVDNNMPFIVYQNGEGKLQLTNTNTIYASNTGDHQFYRNGSARFIVNNGGALVNGYFEVNGSSNFGSGLFKGYYCPSGFCGTNSLADNFSIKVSHRILADAFASYSDRRIKKDFRLSNKTTDLSTLQKLRVTDYRHIDEVSKGKAFVKGFIAQEVEEVFPEAVSQQSNFIPDVYAISTRTNFSDGKLTISLGKNHGFTVGDEVKLMMPGGEKKVIVMAVPSENAFVVDWDAAAADKVFVYGKKVSDFHTVDYDRIFTLNVSATQELARRLEQLEKDLSDAQAENAALRQENGTLRSDLNGIEQRLLKLENQATGTAQK